MLPTVVIIGTGGTIAGAGASPTLTTRYQAAQIGIERIAESVPDLARVARLEFRQPAQKASYELGLDDWIAIRRDVVAALAREDVAGAVITHGTDTLEETAFFLHHSVASSKPVVLTGAMRPATAYSADGPANVLAATVVAAAEEARGRGTMVVMDDRIHGARAVAKVHCANVEAFSSRSAGLLGTLADGRVSFLQPAPPEGARPVFEPGPAAALPRVGLVFAYQGIEAAAVEAQLAAGLDGLVYAGTGNGNVPAAVRPALARAAAAGVAVLRSSRGLEGRITRNSPMFDDDAYGTITAGELTPQKARVLLMLALTRTRDRAALQAVFDHA
jgi:L-asparaginase type II